MKSKGKLYLEAEYVSDLTQTFYAIIASTYTLTM